MIPPQSECSTARLLSLFLVVGDIFLIELVFFDPAACRDARLIRFYGGAFEHGPSNLGHVCGSAHPDTTGLGTLDWRRVLSSKTATLAKSQGLRRTKFRGSP
jgi:hypothetical protein